MKLFLSYLIIFACINQQTIIPIEQEYSTPENNKDDVYFKDVNNVLDKFVGTWKYEDTSTNFVFEITFTKDLHMETIDDNSYVDELFGQFKLSINGIEQYNTYTTECEECIIPIGFLEEEIIGATQSTFLPPNINKYFMAMAEPVFQENVQSSELTLEHINGLGVEKLIWTNKVSTVHYYQTNTVVNAYQSPLIMELIKQ